jgi:ADP-dependent NAD(P)H-hydrate dehydratase / NAD(P)H-hydrate epimerase
MRAVTVAEMLAAEKAAKVAGWSEDDLLDLAGSRLGRTIGRFFPRPGTAVGYLGKGHNAGDTIVALAVLRDDLGWSIAVRQGFAAGEMAPLARAKLAECRMPAPLEHAPVAIDLRSPLLLIDGLVGIGSRGPLRPPLDALANEMNLLRSANGAMVAAVDLPSGIDADSGQPGSNQVVADATFTIANAKIGLLQACAADAVGALAVVPVEILSHSGCADLEPVIPAGFSIHKHPRPFDFHKGRAGRVTIIAGSLPYTGAAVLCAIGALRAGAGLISLFVPSGTESLIAARCPPEIIIRSFVSPIEVFAHPADALVVGCGLGPLDESSEREILSGIESSDISTVLDADALNIVSKLRFHRLFKPNHVITPHPGEFARLAPDMANLSRIEQALQFGKKYPCTLLLKGSRTLVSSPDGNLLCNTTGHPGMASGGQGDLLSGVIGALLAGGLPCRDSAALGAWLCGRASEIAIWAEGESAESLTASDTARCLGTAFHDWRQAYR